MHIHLKFYSFSIRNLWQDSLLSRKYFAKYPCERKQCKNMFYQCNCLLLYSFYNCLEDIEAITADINDSIISS